MKIAKLMSVVCAAGLLMVVGCNKDTKASAGDMGKKTECCGKCTTGKANMGAVKEKSCSSSCSDKASSCTDKASMGAVSGQKSDCSTKTQCTDKASMGAVAPKKSGCCPSKTN